MFKEIGQIAGMLKNLGKLREEAERFRSRLAELQTEGMAGGGLVRVRVNGRLEVLRIEIAPDAPLQDREMLEDLITAAVNMALDKARELVSQEAQKMAQALGVPPGMEIPGLT
jgi:DNA-binding YbaB/EbfC family protein